MSCIHLRQLNFPECYESPLELGTERKACDQDSICERGDCPEQACSQLLLEDIVESVCY